MRELRHAIRQLLRTPAFTVVAVLTLALGMGANTAFFSVLYGVVLQQPPYPAADRLVALHNVKDGRVDNGGMLSRAEVREYGERQRAFESIAANDLGRMTLAAPGGGESFAERVKVSRVTPELFATLGVGPVLGRTITAADAQGQPVAVISYDFWQRHLGGREDALARRVRLNGIEYAIAGIMPAGFSYPESDMAAWLPLDLAPRDSSDRTDHYLAAIGRLRAGVRTADARRDLERVAGDLQRDLPAAYSAETRSSIGFDSLRQRQFGRMLLPLGTLMAAAASVLLIACVNVAIMSLLRALARRREISIRLALGASRRSIVKLLVTEAGLLCAAGAAGGLTLAAVALRVLKAFAPGDIPRLAEVGIDATAALFTAAILILVTVIVGFVPGLVASRMRSVDGLLSATRVSEGRVTVRLRDGLTIAEIALASALVICAGLSLRSLHALTRVDIGFATEQRFSFKTNLTADAYPTPERVDVFYDQLNNALSALPGTRSIGAVSYVPLSGEGQAVEAAPATGSIRGDSPATVGWGIVRGRYFETMGVGLVAGRLFDRGDRAGSLPVLIVDDLLAGDWWGSPAAAIGQRVSVTVGMDVKTRTVVGVVRHVEHVGPGKTSFPAAYAPQSQVYQRGMYTVLETSAPPATVMAAARAALTSIDPAVPLYFAETLGARYDSSLAVPRFTAGLVAAFSTVALVLAGVGVFGVTAYAARQRMREFGIRVALGAQRSHISALVLLRVGILAALGLAAGGWMGVGLGSLMSGSLFRVEPGDTTSTVIAVGAIAITALLASIAPVRNAVRVDPAVTLRAE